MIDDVMIFSLGDQRFGLPLQVVAQVIRAVAITPLPQASANVLGVITIQGGSVPVLSLRQLLHLSERELGPDDQFIILKTEQRCLALVVDDIQGVMNYPEQDRMAVESPLPGMEFVKGVIRTREGALLIKDIDLFLSCPDEQLFKEMLPSFGKIPEQPVPVQTGFDVIVFTLVNDHYGIETTFVREVFPAMDVIPIPCTPSFVAGVINVRGDILAVIDLKTYFGFPVSEPASPGEVIIVEMGESLFGILADSTLGVSFVSLADFQSPSPGLSGTRAESLRGLTKGQVFVLDIPGMLAAKKLWVHEEVTV
jgi:purine-binding chemotaxis protein CheW